MKTCLLTDLRFCLLAALSLGHVTRVATAAESAEEAPVAIPGHPAASAGLLIDHVWSGHPVPFALLTERGYQFIAYYDAERKITVTGRQLGETNWTRVQPEGVWVTNRNRFSNVTGWDAHNYLTLALDRDGCLHLSGNLHTDPLVYYRTERPFDLTTLKRIDRMTGERERSTTYPRFSRHPDGRLVFKYRDGGSGNGSDLYNIYDPDTRSWRRLFDGPLIDGEGERSAYGTGPQRGPDGFYHMLWMWRDTPDAMSNHTLSYVRSRDLVSWETSAGKPIARPITMAGAEVIDAAKPGGGLINMTYALGWDAQKRPVAAYHRYDTNGHSQIYVSRADGKGNWQTRQISDWKFRWEFPGHGSQVKQVSVGWLAAEVDGSLIIEFSAKQAGAGRWRLNGETLAVMEQLPARKNSAEPAAKPRGNFPGLQVQTQSAQAGDTRWLLRWETLGINRDLANRDVPPPSELRLYELRNEAKTSGIPESQILERVKTNYLAAFKVQNGRLTAGVVGEAGVERPAMQCWNRITTLLPPEELSGIVQFNILGGRRWAGRFDGSGKNDVGREGYRFGVASYLLAEEPDLAAARRPASTRRDTLDWTLVHELGHYLGLRDGWIERFSEAFDGDTQPQPTRRRQPDDYPADGSPRLDANCVTSYAERNAGDEEAVETFTAFLLVKELPQNDSLAARKVRFFSDIAAAQAWRERIQQLVEQP